MAVMCIEAVLQKVRKQNCNGSLHRNGQHKYIILKLGGAMCMTENNIFQYLS